MSSEYRGEKKTYSSWDIIIWWEALEHRDKNGKITMNKGFGDMMADKKKEKGWNGFEDDRRTMRKQL